MGRITSNYLTLNHGWTNIAKFQRMKLSLLALGLAFLFGTQAEPLDDYVQDGDPTFSWVSQSTHADL